VRLRTYTAMGQEILMISLVRLSYPHRWEDVERIFPRLKRWKLQSYFYWYLILNNRDYWEPQMGDMANAIQHKIAAS